MPRSRNFGYTGEFTQWLDDHHILWTYERSVPLTDIVRQEESQARMLPHGEDKLFVKRYRSLIKASGGRNLEKFPPVVLWANGFSDEEDGRMIYRRLDGNHRLVAAELEGITHTDAIVVDVDSEAMAVIVSSRPNIEAGKAYNTEEVLKVALAMTENGWTASKIAEELGVSGQKISNLLAAQRFDDRIDSLSMDPEFKDLNRAAKTTLNNLHDNSVFEALTHLTKDAGLNSRDIGAIRKQIEDAGSESERLQIVADRRIDLEETIRDAALGMNAGQMPLSLRAGGALSNLSSLVMAYPDATQWLPKRDATRREWLLYVSNVVDFLPGLVTALNDALGSDPDDDDDDDDEDDE